MVEERNRIILEDLSEKIERIYGLVLKIEEKMEDQKQHLKCLFDRVSAIETRSRPEYKKIMELK